MISISAKIVFQILPFVKQITMRFDAQPFFIS